jgi:hypothetical protein
MTDASLLSTPRKSHNAQFLSGIFTNSIHLEVVFHHKSLHLQVYFFAKSLTGSF